MKLCFSTLGCPAWSLEQIVERAQAYGFDGVEIRGIQGEMDFANVPAFERDALAATRGMFTDAGLRIVVLGTSAKFSSPDAAEREANLDDARACIKLAQKLGAPYVRVFGGAIPPEMEKEDTIAVVGDCLRSLAEYGDDRGVRPLLETHDAWVLSEDVAAAINRAEHRGVGVIWDVRHTCHAGEPVEETFARLRPWIRHVHLKDEDRDGYCPLGQGAVPNERAIRLLAGHGYNGYFSFEWEKAWQPDLTEPEEVFPLFVAKMREYGQFVT